MHASNVLWLMILAWISLSLAAEAGVQSRIDLSVDSVQVNTPRLSKNQKVEVVAVIRNNGSEAVGNLYLQVDVRKQGKRVKAIKDIPVLSNLPRSGSSQAIPISVGALGTGEYEAIVKADPDNEIAETDESNNEKKVIFYVTEPIA